MTDGNTYEINKNLDKEDDGDETQETHTEREQAEARIEELEAKLEDQAERIEELEQACEVVSSEFEGELWQACRRLLQKTHFDFNGTDVDGIRADDFESHMNETLVEFDNGIASAEAAEAKLAKAVCFVGEVEAGPSWGESLPSWVNSRMLSARTTLAELKGQGDD